MTLAFLVLFLANLFLSETPTYRIQYQLTYQPDSTNPKRHFNESFLLFVKPNERSVFASENFLKKDSVSILVKNGTLTVNDIIADERNRFKTRFDQFVRKEYAQKTIKLY